MKQQCDITVAESKSRNVAFGHATFEEIQPHTVVWSSPLISLLHIGTDPD